MSEAIKIRATLHGDIADIRVLLQHPMETGQRKDDSGRTVPAHFIQTFSLLLNGKPLIDGQLNTSVAKNPLFVFRTRGLKRGDRLTAAWLDNTGSRRQDEITIA